MRTKAFRLGCQSHPTYLSIDLDYFPHNICVDLNGFVYMYGVNYIQILDPRKNYKRVQILVNDRKPCHNLCFDDKNRLMVVDNQTRQLNIFD